MATHSPVMQECPHYRPRDSHADRLAAADKAAATRWRTATNLTWYPEYHIAPYTGWMNDPNGLLYFLDRYHVFYQYHPYSADWGPMHWGHVTSEDLVHWHHECTALAPGDSCDRDGCFSGSAVSYEGKLFIFYTGHFVLDAPTAGNPDAIYEQQCVAVSEDGIHFTKLGPVVRPPPGYVHFRDPKVWQQDGQWWMVCGARSASKDLGQLLLFTTTDLTRWDDSTWQVLGMTEDKNVFMWECPDYFTMGRREDLKILLFCPQGKRADNYEYRNRFQNGYIAGQWLPGSSWAVERDFRELDHGHDFYASQTFLAADGQRRLIFGWFNMWESPMPTKEHGWCGCLTLPRELQYSESSGLLRMLPAKELVALRAGEATVVPAVVLDDNSDAQLLEECRAYELEITLNVETSTAEKYGLWLGSGAELYVDAQSSRLVLNRHYPQHMLSGYRSCEMPTGVLLRLHVYIDRSSMEVFVNDGEACFSSRIFPDDGDRTLSVFATNGTADVVGGSMWRLKSVIEH